MSEQSAERRASRAHAAAEAMDRPTQGVTPGDVAPGEPGRHEDDGAADREAYLAHELPDEWVAELEKPVVPYETELDGLLEAEAPGRGPGVETRERAQRAAQTMNELSRGLTLGSLSLRELIGRDRS